MVDYPYSKHHLLINFRTLLPFILADMKKDLFR